MPTRGTFGVEISLAKGIIFRKIGLANGAILKLWAAHPCPRFSREPPPPVIKGEKDDVYRAVLDDKCHGKLEGNASKV